MARNFDALSKACRKSEVSARILADKMVARKGRRNVPNAHTMVDAIFCGETTKRDYNRNGGGCPARAMELEAILSSRLMQTLFAR